MKHEKTGSKYLNFSCFFIYILLFGILLSSAWAWNVDAGDPLFAQIMGSNDDLTWFDPGVSICNGQPVYLRAVNPDFGSLVTTDQHSLNGNPVYDWVTCYWNYGDGSYDTGNFVVHTYATAGNYTAYLTVVDSGPYWPGTATNSEFVYVVADTGAEASLYTNVAYTNDTLYVCESAGTINLINLYNPPTVMPYTDPPQTQKWQLNGADYYTIGSGGAFSYTWNTTYTVTTAGTFVFTAMCCPSCSVYTVTVVVSSTASCSCSGTVDTTKYLPISSRLPDCGTFTQGTWGWTIVTTAGGSVNSYTNATEGWIGLAVSSTGGTAAIQTYSGTTNSYTDLYLSNWKIDEIIVCVRLRANPLLTGTFKVDLYGAYTTEPMVQEAQFGPDTTTGSGIAIGPEFKQLEFYFTPNRADFYQIGNLKLSYIVPSGYTTQNTEVQIDCVSLYVYRVLP